MMVLTITAKVTDASGLAAEASVTVDVVDGVASVRKLEAGAEETQA